MRCSILISAGMIFLAWLFLVLLIPIYHSIAVVPEDAIYTHIYTMDVFTNDIYNAISSIFMDTYVMARDGYTV
jgi:hypothetical protein